MRTYRSWIGTLATVAALAAGCTYRAAIPEGIVACDKQRETCPAGFRCAALPSNPSLSVCTRMETLGMDAAPPPKDTRETGPAQDTTPPPPGMDMAPSAPDVQPDQAPDVPAVPDVPSLPDAADAPPDQAKPDAVVDAAPDTSNGCPAGKGGPRLQPAGAFCIDESEVTNDHYRAFLAGVVRSNLHLPAECAAKVDFIPVSSAEVMWNPQRPGNFPVVNVDWCDAYAFCAWAGKRLCGKIGGGVLAIAQSATASVSQWASACSREGTRTYPYGEAGQGMCNVGKPRMPIAFGAVKSYPRCEGGYPGVFDLVGNVEEWVDACVASPTKGGDCAVVGGAFAPETENPDCNTAWFAGHRLDAYFRRGFRCCSN